MTLAVPADVISRLKAVLGDGGWSQDPERLAPKLVEWRDRWSGCGRCARSTSATTC